MSTETHKNNRQTRTRHRGVLLSISVACWLLTATMLLWRASVLRPPAVVFPYEPILRSTTTVDDTRPLPVPETERNRIFIQATVPPVRTVVLDSHGQISEIWSNTAGNVYHYTLYVRRGDRDGPLVDYSPTVHTQYAMLIPLVDWRPSGRVYPTVESSKNSVVSASPIRRLSFRE